MAVFVDTNVLVYERDVRSAEKQRAAHRWLTYLWRSGEGRVSFQVLQEFYVTVTRKLPQTMEPADARKVVRGFMTWGPISIDEAIIDDTWSIGDRHHISFWDALIVAAASRAGCDRLLTEDLQDGQVFDGVRIVDPFTTEVPFA